MFTFLGSVQNRNTCTLTLQVKIIYRLYYPKLFSIILSLAEQCCNDNQQISTGYVNKIVYFLSSTKNKNKKIK